MGGRRTLNEWSDGDPDGSRTSEVTEAFERLFADVYLRCHRRDAQNAELTGASRAVLLHLAMTGPLPIGEAALHLGRAQSVVSEIVDQLEGHGLLERERDPADRRRVLVWLTPSRAVTTAPTAPTRPARCCRSRNDSRR